jgi:hypothetical protein
LERVLSRCINMDLNNIETIIRMVVIMVTRTSSNMASIPMDRQTAKFLPDLKDDRQKAATKQNERLSSVVEILLGADAFGIKPRFVTAYLNRASYQNWSMLHRAAASSEDPEVAWIRSTKPNIEALDRGEFSFRLERIWCVFMFCLVVGIS